MSEEQSVLTFDDENDENDDSDDNDENIEDQEGYSGDVEELEEDASVRDPFEESLRASNIPDPPEEVKDEEDKPKFEYVDDNMHVTVFSLFFCPIIGMAAIVKSYESKHNSFRKEYIAAQRASKTALRLAAASMFMGIIYVSFGVLMWFYTNNYFFKVSET